MNHNVLKENTNTITNKEKALLLSKKINQGDGELFLYNEKIIDEIDNMKDLYYILRIIRGKLDDGKYYLNMKNPDTLTKYIDTMSEKEKSNLGKIIENKLVAQKSIDLFPKEKKGTYILKWFDTDEYKNKSDEEKFSILLYLMEQVDDSERGIIISYVKKNKDSKWFNFQGEANIKPTEDDIHSVPKEYIFTIIENIKSELGINTNEIQSFFERKKEKRNYKIEPNLNILYGTHGDEVSAFTGVKRVSDKGKISTDVKFILTNPNGINQGIRELDSEGGIDLNRPSNSDEKKEAFSKLEKQINKSPDNYYIDFHNSNGVKTKNGIGIVYSENPINYEVAKNIGLGGIIIVPDFLSEGVLIEDLKKRKGGLGGMIIETGSLSDKNGEQTEKIVQSALALKGYIKSQQKDRMDEVMPDIPVYVPEIIKDNNGNPVKESELDNLDIPDECIMKRSNGEFEVMVVIKKKVNGKIVRPTKDEMTDIIKVI